MARFWYRPLRHWWAAWLLALPALGIALGYLLLGHNALARIFAGIYFALAFGWVLRGLWERGPRSN
jgi:hypothetical protein